MLVFLFVCMFVCIFVYSFVCLCMYLFMHVVCLLSFFLYVIAREGIVPFFPELKTTELTFDHRVYAFNIDFIIVQLLRLKCTIRTI